MLIASRVRGRVQAKVDRATSLARAGTHNARSREESRPGAHAEPTKPRLKLGGLTDQAVAWFARSGISRETLGRKRITVTTAWMPGAPPWGALARTAS